MTKGINKTYSVDEVFTEIDGDPENVLMNIPPEIVEKLGWNPGDNLLIQILKSGELSITKVTDGKE